jgi:site-specific recombinase XerD
MSQDLQTNQSYQEQLSLFSTPESHYIFKGPATLPIKSAVKGLKNYCTLELNCWNWRYGGNLTSIDWTNFNCNPCLREILKAYIFHRLQTLSPASVSNIDVKWLTCLRSNIEFQVAFPWESKEFFLKLLSHVKTDRLAFFGFKAFYKFGFARGFYEFTKEYNDIIEEIPAVQQSNAKYQKVLLQQFNKLTPADESILLDYIYTPVNIGDYSAFRDNIILHLAFELAPRPIQLHSLSAEDLEVVDSASNKERYFSLWLPMAKKRNTNDIEKRYRKITAALGEKIALLLQENKRLYGDEQHVPLLLNPRNASKSDDNGGRLSSNAISDIICGVLQSKGFKKGDGATLLRHHLAQSLADQGASAETIAEILGHNSTLPARAYIAATPTIATIKTRALGKNKTYENIMSMLLTGQIIEKQSAGKGKWVKGMVGNQYIGGIGACGLTENTACPKNPVYACYTCAKFHPFRDGTHHEVKVGLQKQAQYFIDIAEAAMDLQHNRTYVQLERTIEAVDAVIYKIESEK